MTLCGTPVPNRLTPTHRQLQRIAPSFLSSTSPFTSPSVSRLSRANCLKIMLHETAAYRFRFASGGTGVNVFFGCARTQSSFLVIEITKGRISTLVSRAAIQSKMTTARATVWNLPPSSETLRSRLRRKMRLRGWKRCQGNLTDSFGLSVAVLKISKAKVDKNHLHSASCLFPWKIGIDRSCIGMQPGQDSLVTQKPANPTEMELYKLT